jgi:fused signal recognition particle receptor
VFWRRRKQDEPAPDQDLEPTVEPVEPEDEAEAAEDALIPADEAPIDDDLEPQVEPEPEPPIEEPVAPSASPFAQPGWSASSMAAAPAQDRERLDAGLARSRGGFMASLRAAFGEEGDAAWDDVEETLIAGDVGAALAMDVVEKARGKVHADGKEAAVREELAALLVARDVDWTPRPAGDGQPAVILVVGVNGTGKTTTIGKLATRYAGEGRSVILAAADTFRAAAIDQLRIWAERAGVPVVAHAPGADPGAVVYDALDAAVARDADLVIADTAGRLHTKANLMDELSKIRRIVDKRLPGAQPETLFVLDATTGQNGLAQAKAFHEAVGLTGIVLTKLDSTAKGGIVFAIEDALGVPVRFVGVGEQVGDLVPFDPEAFVAALFGEPQAPIG